MEPIKELNIDANYHNEAKLSKHLTYFKLLLEEIRKRKIADLNAGYVNQHIDELNHFKGSVKALKKILRKNKNLILRMLEKDHNITPKNYYRNKWMGIGMLIYGVSFGVIFSSILGNYAFVGVGLPIGMVLGMAIGANKDNKAKEQGNQLDIETS